MSLENRVWILSLIFMALIALIFVYVLAQTRRTVSSDANARTHVRAERIRNGLFAAFIMAFAAVSWVTLYRFPIPEQHQPLAAKQVVKVLGRQWVWQLSSYRIKAGEPVEFRVTSADVNHDFAVYNPQGTLVAQVQAMPGYTNKLLHTFHQTGTYTVRCLEYCGVGHANMMTTFKVVKPKTGSTKA